MYEKERAMLIERAKENRSLIFPVGNKKTFDECFTIETIDDNLILYFWYNDEDGSSHLEKYILTSIC